jgi:hypothetical protein
MEKVCQYKYSRNLITPEGKRDLMHFKALYQHLSERTEENHRHAKIPGTQAEI